MSIFGKLFGNGSNQSKADNFKSWRKKTPILAKRHLALVAANL